MHGFNLEENVIPIRRYLKRSYALHHYRPVASTSITWSFLRQHIINNHSLGSGDNPSSVSTPVKGFLREFFIRKMAKFIKSNIFHISMTIIMLWVCTTQAWPVGDCGPCKCYLDSSNAQTQFRGRTADCSNLQLVDIPVTLDPKIDHLILNNNSLLTIRESDLSVYQQLKTLSVRNNNFITLEPDVFEHCPLLYHVDLTGNSFTVLPDDVFRKAPLLRELHGVQMPELAMNQFHNLTKLHTLSLVVTQSSLPAEQFQHLAINQLSLELTEATHIHKDLLQPVATTLMRFSLNAPKLQAIDKDLFNDMILLEKIHLDIPEVDSLPESIFLGERLVSVDMTEMLQNIVSDVFDSYLAPEKSMMLNDVSFIGVRELPAKLFRHSPYIERVAIHNTEVIPTDLFKNLRRLNQLDLSNNGLSELPGLWFSDLDGLKHLNLSHNQLERIQLQIFQLQSLKQLDLSHNQLRHINKMALSSFSASLETLDLSHNELTAIQPTLLGTMWSLSRLNLSNNYIQRLPGRVFADLQKLQSLSLEHNHIQQVSSDSFAGLQDLIVLDIHDNYIKVLPDASMFDDSSFLMKLDLSQNNLIIIPNLILSNHFWLKSLNLKSNQIMCGCSIEHLQELNDEFYTEISGECLLDTTIFGDGTTTAQPKEVVRVSLVEVNATVACFYEQNRTLTYMYTTGRTPPVINFTETKIPSAKIPQIEVIKIDDIDSNALPDQGAQKGASAGNQENPPYLNPMLWTIGSVALLCVAVVVAVVVYKMRGVIYRRSYHVRNQDIPH